MHNRTISNPGKTVTIYSWTGYKCTPEHSLAPDNIVSGFHTAGIMPANPENFTGEHFLSSEVTDRLISEQAPQLESTAQTEFNGQHGDPSQPEPSTSPTGTAHLVSPQDIRPLSEG